MGVRAYNVLTNTKDCRDSDPHLKLLLNEYIYLFTSIIMNINVLNVQEYALKIMVLLLLLRDVKCL